MKRTSALLLGLFIAWTTAFAGDTISNYTCDFEDEVQNLKWHFPVNAAVPHHWTIGEAVNNGGRHSLYVTPNGLDTPCYVNTSAIVYAYADITLRNSSEKYILSFDWMAAGFTANMVDALYAFWVPDKDDLGDSIYISDQNTSSIPNQLKNYIIPLNPAMTCPDSLGGKSTWQAWISSQTSTTDSRLRGGRHRRLVFAWRNGNDGPVNPGACIDNIAIVDGRACSAPQALTITTEGEDSLVLNWDGDIQGYEVGCYSYEKNQWQIVRVDTNHYVYTDVPEGFTDFYVRTICWDTLNAEEYFSAKAQTSEFIYYPGKHCIDYITLSDENCYISTVKTNYVTDDYKYVNEMVDNGPEEKSSRHTHHYSKIETDVRTGGRLRAVPEGEIASTRLGNWNNGGESERAEFNFHVDVEQNPILVMKYAVVLESPGHDKGKQPGSKNLQDPRFTLDVLHKGKSIGRCAAADYTSSWVTEGWNDTTVNFIDEGKVKKVNVVWKDWTTVGVNLEDYDGENLTIRLTTYDCSMTAHFGYAYFTLGCAKKELGGTRCDGKPSTDFLAPDGFKYRWYAQENPDSTIATTQDFHIDSLDSRIYNVDVIFPEDSTCHFTLEAMSQPRYPVSDFAYEHVPSKCHNYIDIKNLSRVETVYLKTNDTVISAPDKIEWDFGVGKGNPIAYNKSGLVEFPNEGGSFPVTVTTYFNTCSETRTIYVNVPAIGEQITDTTVYRCPGDSYYFEGYNYDGSYVRNPNPYTELGVYQDTLISRTGCDSIIRTTLDILKPVTSTIDAVILVGDSFIFHDMAYTQTGIYIDTILSVHGCDSLIDTLDLYVHEYLRVEMASNDAMCADAGIWNIPFSIIQGARSCDGYSLTWDESDPGLPIITHAPLPADSIFRITISTTVYPDYYHANFVFHDSLRYLDPEQIKDADAQTKLAIQYADTVITQRWNDVLAIRNAEHNGGYHFDAVQWYLNGAPIEGATSFNYYAGDDQSLKMGADYSALLTRNDGVALMTCVYVPVPVPEAEQPMPSLVPLNTPLHVQGKGTAFWYDMLGRAQQSQTYDDSSIKTPATAGYYVLVLEGETRQSRHPMVVR